MAVGGIFQYIGSNSLTFVRDEDRSLKQTDSNRLYGDYEYFNQYLINYAQPYEQTDNLRVQFRTNYKTFSVTLVSESGSEQALIPSLVSEETDYNYYDVIVDLSSLDGCYYIKSQANSDYDKVIANFTSNYFNVKEDQPYTELVEWYGNSAYDDGYVWEDDTQELRVRANFIDVISSGEPVTMIDSDNNIALLNYEPSKRKKFQLDLVPDYIALLLNRAIGHDLLIINGETYNIDSVFDFGERLGYSRMYKPSIDLQLRDYENYNKIDELEGELPEIPETSLAFDETSSLAFDETSSLAYTQGN
jgi:hypothetical protein